MVPLPPKYRSFISVPEGVKAKSIPAPEGFSLVTSHVYTNCCLFFENVQNDPNFMHWQKVKNALEKTLDYYYPLTGRLIKGDNGRYSITNFEKGALFEVIQSTDDFQDYKRCNFSYSVVPYEEMLSISSYVSRDSPLCGIKLTYTKCGSCILVTSFHHKVADGWCLNQFIWLFSRICRGERIGKDEFFVYMDRDRQPVQPLQGIDHAELYPSYLPDGKPPQPSIQMGIPSKKVIFSFDRGVMKKLRLTVLEEAGQPNSKISQFDILSAFVHRAVVKARRNKDDDACGNLLCVVGAHHQHPDEKMVKYVGNFIMPVPVPNTVKQVLEKSLFELASEVHERTRSINVPFMESLEYYLNHSKQVESLVSPIHAIGKGAVGFTDWSRFAQPFDFGYGPYVRMRSFVQTSPLAIITVMPFLPEAIEVIVQLDSKSINQLVTDREFISYVKAIN